MLYFVDAGLLCGRTHVFEPLIRGTGFTDKNIWFLGIL